MLHCWWDQVWSLVKMVTSRFLHCKVNFLPFNQKVAYGTNALRPRFEHLGMMLAWISYYTGGSRICMIPLDQESCTPKAVLPVFWELLSSRLHCEHQLCSGGRSRKWARESDSRWGSRSGDYCVSEMLGRAYNCEAKVQLWWQ